MISLAPSASIFRDECFFKMRCIFLSPFLAPSDFSKCRPEVRNSGRTFEIRVERSDFRSNVRNSGRTFEFPVERSNSRSNVRKNENSKIRVWSPKMGFKNVSPNVRPEFRTFDQDLERSTGISNVRPEFRTFGFPRFCGERWTLELGAQKRASRISRGSKFDLLDMNIHIPGSKISNLIDKQPKMTKQIPKVSKEFEKLQKTK